MPLVKKLTKLGSSYALVLDKSFLKCMNISEQDKIQMEVQGSTVQMKKYSAPDVLQEQKVPFARALDHSIKKFDKVYKKLTDA